MDHDDLCVSLQNLWAAIHRIEAKVDYVYARQYGPYAAWWDRINPFTGKKSAAGNYDPLKEEQ